MVARWYVAQVVPRCEAWAIKNARAQAFEVFWPRYELQRKVGSAKYYKGVFPGYIFVNFDVFDDSWRGICHTFGIKRVLGATDYGASSIPYGFVENMIEAAPDGLIDIPKQECLKFNYGDKLKVIDGPFAGRVGIFQQSEKDRVALLLSLLGRETRVYFAIDKVTYAGAVI